VLTVLIFPFVLSLSEAWNGTEKLNCFTETINYIPYKNNNSINRFVTKTKRKRMKEDETQTVIRIRIDSYWEWLAWV